MDPLDIFIASLWQDYITLNPHAKAVFDLFVSHGETPVNDHIALRTFDHPLVDMYVLAATFERHGYQPADFYTIDNKCVDALYLSHTEPDRPRVFISQLRTKEFSDDFQRTIERLVSQMPPDAPTTESFLWSGRPWQPVKLSTYRMLKEESDYAAWLAVFGYRTNHFTVSINRLRFTQDIYQLNAFLKANGILLNTEGGEVKGSPDVLLEQSSTMAGSVTVAFSDGLRKIPACYYEFAKRYPHTDGTLYDGFIATSASKIFESTNG